MSQPNHKRLSLHSAMPSLSSSVSSSSSFSIPSPNTVQSLRAVSWTPISESSADQSSRLPQSNYQPLRPRSWGERRRCRNMSDPESLVQCRRSRSIRMDKTDDESNNRRVSFNERVTVVHSDIPAKPCKVTEPPIDSPSSSRTMWWDDSQLAVELADDELIKRCTLQRTPSSASRLKRKLSAIIAPGTMNRWTESQQQQAFDTTTDTSTNNDTFALFSSKIKKISKLFR